MRSETMTDASLLDPQPKAALPNQQVEGRQGKLPVMEVFGPTIQGEGVMIGTKTMFVRLGGCDYRCRMCDSLFAVIPQVIHAHATWMYPEEIAEEVAQKCGRLAQWVTLSGGNPAIWEEGGELVRSLQQRGFKVALETQGTLWQDWVALCNQVTISPKGPGMGEKFEPDKFSDFLMRCSGTMTSIKVVVFSALDLEFAITVDALLDYYVFPREERFLSLGNPWPPIPARNFQAAEGDEDIPKLLLHSFKDSLEQDFLNDWRLAHWKYLPQLHVLVWGNERAR
jgi:7-carboxy-7-deazaguanine synthase